MVERPTGTVTFMFTDMVGAASIWDGQPEAMQQVQDRHDAIIRRACIDHGGYVFANLGDGFGAAFASATDAAKAAVDAQQAIASERWPTEAPVRIRMGLHTGEAVERDGLYFGPAVIRAAGVAGAAGGGQVVVSGTTAGIINGRLPNGIVLEDLGEHHVRGLSRPERIFKLVGAGLVDDLLASYQAVSQSRIAAILFMDITDSTGLTERIGDAAFRAKARELDAVLRALIRDHGGSPIEGKLLGDGVLATFPSARDVIDAAQHCRLAGHGIGLQLHLGIHAGDVIRESNNVYGGAVNIASRISGLSAPGQILVSDVVRGLARTSSSARFLDWGEHTLRGIQNPVRLFEIQTNETSGTD